VRRDDARGSYIILSVAETHFTYFKSIKAPEPTLLTRGQLHFSPTAKRRERQNASTACAEVGRCRERHQATCRQRPGVNVAKILTNGSRHHPFSRERVLPITAERELPFSR